MAHLHEQVDYRLTVKDVEQCNKEKPELPVIVSLVVPFIVTHVHDYGLVDGRAIIGNSIIGNSDASVLIFEYENIPNGTLPGHWSSVTPES